jgi:glycosyltransferase involved in cell wall biosynthesis
MAHRILADVPFTAGIQGHGGDHRTAQLLELLQQAEIEPSLLQPQSLSQRSHPYLEAISAILNPRTLLFILKHHLKISRTLAAIAFCGFQRNGFKQAMQQHSGSRVMLWESIKYYVTPYVAKECEFKTIAVPHNVDCLLSGANQYRSLETEIAALAKADAVFCIAREEQWFLKLRGIPADYLPYYPPEALVNQLLAVRQARSPQSQERFLILGSAGNEPTFLGMLEQLNWLQDIQADIDFQVDVVGFGTERLAPHIKDSRIKIHGAVSSEALNHFLQQAKAALVHQQAGIGALTRIPELLIAGIPVIANSSACRSAFSYSGIYCYEQRDELAELLTKSLPTPEPLARPVLAEKRFIACLNQMIHACS